MNKNEPSYSLTRKTVRFINVGNLVTTHNFSVSSGDSIISINENQPAFDLPTGFVSIAGTIDPNASIISLTVNGEAADISGLTWKVEDLLMSEDGVMVFNFEIDRPGSLATLRFSKEFEVPTHIRVKSFTMDSTEKHDNNTGGSTRYQRKRALTWTHGSGGSYSIEIKKPDSGGTWTKNYEEVIEWNAKGVGQHKVWYNNQWTPLSSTMWDTDFTPPIQSSTPVPGPPNNSTAHRWVDYKYEDNWAGELGQGQFMKDTYEEKSHANLELRVGGRPQANNQSIVKLQLSRDAGEIPFPYYGNVNEDYQRKPFAPTEVSVLSYTFDNTGLLYMPVQNGMKQSYKPKTPASKAFVAPVGGEQKYYLQIFANSQLLTETHISPFAKFSVGQKVQLSSVWIPETPPVAQQEWKWNLDGNLVNSWFYNMYSPPAGTTTYGSRQYILEPSLLQVANPSVWWVSDSKLSKKSNLKVTLGTHVTMKNGFQTVLLKGSFLTLCRPQIEDYEYVFKPWDSRIGPAPDVALPEWLGIEFLQMGRQGTPEGMMFIKVNDISTEFDGSIAFDQLVNLTYTRDTTSNLPLNKNTGGRYAHDGHGFMQDPQPALVFADYNSINLTDAPAVPLGKTYSTIDFAAKSYLQFKPDGQESIWVTLGRYDWEYNSAAVKPNQVWSIHHAPTSDPDFVETDEFPSWLRSILKFQLFEFETMY